jgi:hypothetical protein
LNEICNHEAFCFLSKLLQEFLLKYIFYMENNRKYGKITDGGWGNGARYDLHARVS